VEERLCSRPCTHKKKYVRKNRQLLISSNIIFSDPGKYEFPAKTVIDYLLGRFKEEYTAEANLYSNAGDAEDLAVRERLLAKASELNEKIVNADQQLGSQRGPRLGT